jgi:hypothetical protein
LPTTTTAAKTHVSQLAHFPKSGILGGEPREGDCLLLALRDALLVLLVGAAQLVRHAREVTLQLRLLACGGGGNMDAVDTPSMTTTVMAVATAAAVVVVAAVAAATATNDAVHA